MFGLSYIFNTVWASIPYNIQLFIAILFIIGFFGLLWLKGFDNVVTYLGEFFLDTYNRIKLKLVNWNETKRIETLLNWKKNKVGSKKYYIFNKVKVQNVYDEKDEERFIESTEKGQIIVIKQKLKENKSDNLLSTTFHMVSIGFLANIRKYLSPELAIALTNKEVISKLGEMSDYLAEGKYLDYMTKNETVEELMAILDEIDFEGVYKNMYLPFLLNLETYNQTQPKETQKESERLLKFLNNYDDRLRKNFKSKYFPNFTFVYVKLPMIPIKYHINRVLEGFRKDGCKLVVISGWKQHKRSIKRVSNKIEKEKGFPLKKKFKGNRLRLGTGTFDERTSFVHIKKDFELNTL